MQFEKNQIIDYYDNRRIACGAILEVDDRRLRILTDQGKEANIPVSRALVSDQDPDFPWKGSRDAQVSRLKSLWAAREQLKDAVNLPELWEVVASEASEIDVDELVELLFGDSGDHNHAASLLRAIHEDRLYFRIRPDAIEVSDPERVGRALQQREKERERRDFMARAADFVAILRKAEDVDSLAPPEGLIPMLEEGAKQGPDWVTLKPLKDLFSRAGVPSDFNPFLALVKLGAWSEDENITLRTENVPVEFSSEVDEAAREAAKKPLPEGLEDLTHEHVVTIDSAYTQDVDDALSLSRDGDDWIVGVHITDVSHYVDGDPVLHKELRERATSIYLPDMMIPMIPKVLSEEAASLTAGQDRPAVSVLARVGPDLRLKESRVLRSKIRVKERLSYEDADRRASDPDSPEARLYRVALALRAARVAAGALIFKDPELSVRVNPEKGIEVKVRERETPAQVLVSEMMILANSVFARFTHERGLPGIYRFQPPPLEKIELGENHDPVASYRAKRCLARGDVGLDPYPHSTLGLELYTTATSPLRRYTDLVIQAQVKAGIQGMAPPLDRKGLDRVISEIAYRLDRAAIMERERQRYFLLKYLDANRDREYEAVVLQRFPRFHLVQLTGLSLNAALPASNSASLSPYDRLLVRMDKINPREDRLTVAVVKMM